MPARKICDRRSQQRLSLFSVKAPQPTSTLLIQLNTRRFEKQICLKKPFSFCEVNNQQDKNDWSGYFVQNVFFFWFLNAVLVRFNLKSDLEAAITLNLFLQQLVIIIVNIVSILVDIYRAAVRFSNLRGLIVIDCLFLLLSSYLKPRIPLSAPPLTTAMIYL